MGTNILTVISIIVTIIGVGVSLIQLFGDKNK